MIVACTLYILLFLLPMNGLLFLAARRERQRTRVLVHSYWKLYQRR